MTHRDNAKAWERVADAEYISAEELFARKLTQISATLGDLTKQTTVERIARVFNKPQRKG